MGMRIGQRGYRGDSPWGRGRIVEPTAPPAKWELFIERLGFEGDREVLKEIREGRIRCGIIAQWVRSHASSVFIPSKILAELKVDTRWDWQ